MGTLDRPGCSYPEAQPLQWQGANSVGHVILLGGAKRIHGVDALVRWKVETIHGDRNCVDPPPLLPHMTRLEETGGGSTDRRTPHPLIAPRRWQNTQKTTRALRNSCQRSLSW